MALIPEPAFSTIMSYLHREYDYQRQLMIDELNQKCKGLGSKVDDFLGLVPCLMLPTKCIWQAMQSKYRCYQQKVGLDEEKCTCGYCKMELWGRY